MSACITIVRRIFGARAILTQPQAVPALYSTVSQEAAAGGHADRRLLAHAVHARRSGASELAEIDRRNSPATTSTRPLGTSSRQAFTITPATSVTAEDFAALAKFLDEIEKGGQQHAGLLPGHGAAVLRTGRRATRRRRAWPTKRTARAAWSSKNRSAPTCDTARQLNEVVHDVFSEQQVYRIDHYLGKETVQNLLGAAVRQHDLRADLEPQLHRPRADHRGRGSRRRPPRRLLRHGRRAARHVPEPPAATADDHGDGSAGAVTRPTRCATKR